MTDFYDIDGNKIIIEVEKDPRFIPVTEWFKTLCEKLLEDAEGN